MDFDSARKAMRDGCAVKRSLWDSSLSMDSRGQALWNISEELARSCNPGHSPSRLYEVTKFDVEALDWEIVATVAVKRAA